MTIFASRRDEPRGAPAFGTPSLLSAYAPPADQPIARRAGDAPELAVGSAAPTRRPIAWPGADRAPLDRPDTTPCGASLAALDRSGVAVALFDAEGRLREATRRWRTHLGADGATRQLWHGVQGMITSLRAADPAVRRVAATTMITARGRFQARAAIVPPAGDARGPLLVAVHLVCESDPEELRRPVIRLDPPVDAAQTADAREHDGDGDAPADGAVGMLGAQPPEGSGLAPLTPREREVAQLVAAGATLARAAAALGISAHTARHHLERVYAKLAVRNRVSLVERLGMTAERRASA